ncbi:adhesion G protein-coupled receptor E3-like isoform X2 [Chiloscyllium plagiosum]|uniref:adhesion G protein-coupled receptor E3-like isoform X2 n=1 Tax=Chiloscyllium plagiosum TaxID=36176 RepID=UPI001CB832E5|nr:adhesion G protein-coupled receptor E3-like isoform X2 [Chiloscyllium plagiosum]
MQGEVTMKSLYLSVILAMYYSHYWNQFSILAQTSPDQSEPCKVEHEDHFEARVQYCGNNSIQDLDILESIVGDLIAKRMFASDQQRNESKRLGQVLKIAGLNTCVNVCSYRLSTTYFELEVQVIRFNADQNIRTATLSAHGNLVEIPLEMENGQPDLVAVAFLSYNSTDPKGVGLDMQDIKKPEITIISDIVTGIKRAKCLRKPSEPIRFIFQNNQRTDGCVKCAYIKSGMDNNSASFEQCDTENFNETHTVCKCNQVSDFVALAKMSCCSSILTDIGIFVTLACMAITLFALAICSEKKTVIFPSLLLVELSALTGFDVVGHVVGFRTVCAITAIGLHYLYLTVFAWMFLEGLQLYLMSINLKNMRVSSSTTIQKFKIPLCYLSPVVLVVLSATTCPNACVSHSHCFVQKENNWYFSGPVLLIILVNIVMFGRTFWILTEQISKRNTEISQIKDSRMLTFKILFQLVILGCPWIIGFFVNKGSSEILEYIFIVIIPLQGFLIFLILCVFSTEVRDEFKKWFLGAMRKHKTSTSTLYSDTT